MRSRRRAAVVAAALVLVALAVAPTGLRHLRAAALLAAFAAPDVGGPLATFANAAVDDEDGSLPEGGARTRLYRPRGVAHPAGIVLLHGVHRLGIDEPRLIRFARALAGAGYAVLTPEIAEIAAYRIEPRSIDTIGVAARALHEKLGRRAGVIGMSFAGGLALLAAADPRFRDDVAFTVAVGAHDDLGRVGRFFATDRAERPDGSSQALAAHPYGVLVLVHSDVPSFFSPEDVDAAREAIRLDLGEQHEEARRRADTLTPPGKARLLALLDHRVGEVRPALERFIAVHEGAMRSVSPRDRLGALTTPVFLLHGAGDTVIPATETLWLARDVPRRDLAATLVSPAIVHVEIGKGPSAAERFALVHFMAGILAAADAEP